VRRIDAPPHGPHAVLCTLPLSSMLTLWPLQEVVLSDRVQFVPGQEKVSDPKWGPDALFTWDQSLSANVDRLWTTSRAWASYGTTSGQRVSDDEQLSFENALLHNG
jgi:hypothetical protein